MNIINTSRDEVRPEWLMGGNPDVIEAQEARGQNQLTNGELLPVDCDNKEILEAEGVIFGEPIPDDPIFCKAVLPDGWKKMPTDHSMWSELIDSDGVVKASIFYKAAFYDRSAFMSVTNLTS